MRIQKTGTEGRHEITSTKGKTDKSDRFSKILEVKRKESLPQFDLLGDNRNTVAADVTHQPESVSGTPAPLDVHRLASEIVDHISAHQTSAGRVVEIQFNSQTLEGLRVSVRGEQGQVAINFQTPVGRVAALVQNNLASLRSALENKGIQVSQLIVSKWSG